MSIIKLNNNSLTSVTELPSGLGGDPDVKVDIARLGLRVFANQNLAKQNSNSASYDVFQDSTGITNLTNVQRDSSEFLSSVVQANDTNTMDVLNADSLSTGNMASQVAYGLRGDTKMVSQGDTGLTINDDHPFSTGKSFQTGGWGDSSADHGFWMKDHTGGSNQTGWANFGTGAFTLEFFVKLLSTGWSSGHKYIIDWATAQDTNRMSLAGDGGSESDRAQAYNGQLTNLGYMSSGFIWPDLGTTDWKHIAIVRDGSGNIAQFIGGTRRANGSSSQDNLNYSTSDYLSFGCRHAASSGSSAYMRFANIRVSTSARYDPTQGTCTVPTEELTTTSLTTSATGSFEGATITAGSSTSKMGAVITYKDQAGTNALNSDLVLKLSADNGSNYSTATLTALPDFSSGVKCCSVADLSVTAGTQLKYKIEFANQSSGSKECRVTGVSLQY